MKKTPYKMKGYTYPGTAPIKDRDTSKEMTDTAFDDVDEATDLLKDQGFYVKNTNMINPNAVNPQSPVTKKSPHKQVDGTAIAKGINWDEVMQSSVEAGIDGAVKLGVNALVPGGKKARKPMDQSGFSNMKFGS